MDLAAECMDQAVATARCNEQNLQCTEILQRRKVGKRIYSHAALQKDCAFESHQGHFFIYDF